MRKCLTVVTLVALWACGGGDNITPPPDGQFSLTISGSGAGSAHATTSPAATPAVDCTLNPDGETAGVCSGSYPEGTAVTVELIPANGSILTSWAGDAASCGIQLSCSLTMTRDETAVAQLSTGSALQIISSATYPNFSDNGTVTWVAEVQNPTEQTVVFAEIDFTRHDATGAVIQTDQAFVGPIPPGETRAAQSFSEYSGTESSLDFQIGEVSFTDADPGLSVAQITSSNWHPDPAEGGVVWNVEVQNTGAVELELVIVDLVTYDANGKIVAVSETIVGPIPAGEKASGEGVADLHGNEASAKFQVISAEDATVAASRVRRSPVTSR
jgi:hypothetical protein